MYSIVSKVKTSLTFKGINRVTLHHFVVLQIPCNRPLLQEIDRAQWAIWLLCNLPLLHQPVRRLLSKNIVVALVRHRRIIIRAQLSQIGRLQVPMATARLPRLLHRIPGHPRAVRLEGGDQCVEFRHSVGQLLKVIALRVRALDHLIVRLRQVLRGDL